MKMSLILFLLFSVCIVSYSYANSPKNISLKQGNSLTELETRVLLRAQKSNNRISLDEAKQISDEFATSLNEKKVSGKLKDAFDYKYPSSREIKSVSALLSSDIKNSDMKSGKYKGIEIPDTLAYILDFKNDAGFAIISADARIDYSVLAFTRSGSFNKKTDNPGMILYLEMLDAYLLNSIAEAELQKDSLINNILKKLDLDNIADVSSPTRASWVVENKIGPFISVKWGQNMPFNGSLAQECLPPTYFLVNGYINTNDGRYPTGCVVTAFIQIKSYYEYPEMHPYSGASWAIFKKYKQFHNFNDSAHLPQAERDIRAHAKYVLGNLFRQMEERTAYSQLEFLTQGAIIFKIA